MPAGLRSFWFAALALGLTASMSAAFQMMPQRLADFGPAVSDGQSLDTNLTALGQMVAWQNSPEGDVYALALNKIPATTFEDASPAFPSVIALNFGIPISDDVSLNASAGALSEVMARLNGPAGREFAIAETSSSNDADFDRIAMASIGPATDQ